MTLKELAKVVNAEYRKLEAIPPPHRKDRFLMLSARKWACKELIFDIHRVEEAPFYISANDVIEGFKRRMDNAGCEVKDKKLKDVYFEASDMAVSLMEKFGI